MTSNSPNIQLPEIEIVNPVTGDATIFIGATSQVNVILTNNLQDSLVMTKGTNASQFNIFLPSFLENTAAGILIKQTGWDFVYNPPGYLSLTFNGSIDTSWKPGQAFTFKMENVTSDSQLPATGDVQVSPQNFTGGTLSTDVSQELALKSPPSPPGTPCDITSYIGVQLQDSTVYTSVKSDPLANTLFLEIRNLTDDSIYNGAGPWPKDPVIKVYFIYGSDPGSLAPDNDKSNPQLGSAWNIHSSIQFDPSHSWPVPVQSDNNGPLWSITPGNVAILVKNQVVVVQFYDIISLTSPGPTTMFVRFENFYFNETTPYTNHTFKIPIDKDGRPSRDIAQFFADSNDIEIKNYGDPVTAIFNWQVFGAYSIILEALGHSDRVKPYTKEYGNSIDIQYGQAAIDLSMFQEEITIDFVLTALDAHRGRLDSRSLPIAIEPDFFVDPRDHHHYPVVKLNGTSWIAKNLDFDCGSGSWFVNDKQSYEKQYGRLYTAAAACGSAPPGWKLPSASDWNMLINTLGSPEEAYAWLILGGDAHFDAVLAGWRTTGGQYIGFFGDTVFGNYWTSTPDPANPGNNLYVEFIHTVANIQRNKIITGSQDAGNGMACRYIKDDSPLVNESSY